VIFRLSEESIQKLLSQQENGSNMKVSSWVVSTYAYYPLSDDTIPFDYPFYVSSHD